MPEDKGVENTIQYATLMGGAAEERFNDAIAVVLRNMVDPNTDYNVARSVTVEVSLVPNEMRDSARMKLVVKTKLAPAKSVEGHAYLTEFEDGNVEATEYNPRQMVLPNIADKRKQA